MSLDFEFHAAKGNEFVRLVADELKVPVDMAGKIVRAVFHALRNRLSHEESFQLMAQLPISLKGVYVDGWKFDKDNNRIIHVPDFLDEVRKEDGGMAGFDFSNVSNAKGAVVIVFKALNYFVSEEELNNILSVLPGTLQQFVNESLMGEGTIL